MVLKKLPSNKSIEELLKTLNDPSVESSKEEKIQVEEDDVLTFLRFYNIVPGKKEVKARYLYKIYEKFILNPISLFSFNHVLGLYLQSKKETGDIEKVYLIDQTVLNLSKRALEHLKKDLKRSPHKSLTWRVHFENFIKKYQLKPGEGTDYLWVSTMELYNLYDKWLYSIKKKYGVSLDEFRKLLKAFFEYKQDRYGYYFKLDDSINNYLPLDKKSRIKARNSLTNEKEKKQKKQRKVPRIKTGIKS